MDHLKLVHDAQSALGRVVKDSYWNRAWITQELILSSCVRLLGTKKLLAMKDLAALVELCVEYHELASELD